MRRGKSGITNGKSYYLPREVFTSSGRPDRPTGQLVDYRRKEVSSGHINGNNPREGPNLLTKGSIEDA